MTVFKWEIENACYVHRSSPIESPPFWIEPSLTFKFCLRLYPSGWNSMNNMILVLWRCDNNESSIELEYELRFDSESYLASIGTYTYNFRTPMMFPEERVCLTKSISEREPLLKLTCKINSHSFEDIDKEIMRDLSSDYKTLLEKRTFSDLQHKFGNRVFYFHKAILEARCDNLAEQLNSLHYDYEALKLLESIQQFLYSGKLTTWTTRVMPTLLKKFGCSLYKSMYPFKVSEYSAKTSFVGNSCIFYWLIENFMEVRSEPLFTYMLVGGTIMQLHFFPDREGSCNFSMEILESVNYFVRCKVEIQERDYLFTLAEMSNIADMSKTGTSRSFLCVNYFVSFSCVMAILPVYVRNGAIKLKIHIHMSNFGANGMSYVDAMSYTNVYKDDMYMYNLREDFKKLFHRSQYYDFEITVNYQMFQEDYERYRASYVKYLADDAMFDKEYPRMHAEYIKWNTHYARFPVHKAILSARSSTFHNMLSHDFIETERCKMEITDIKPYILHKMLLFMYYGELKHLNVECAIDLYCAADKYDIKMLVTKCSEFLESSIEADNVDEIQRQVQLRNNERLNTACDQFRRNVNIIG